MHTLVCVTETSFKSPADMVKIKAEGLTSSSEGSEQNPKRISVHWDALPGSSEVPRVGEYWELRFEPSAPGNDFAPAVASMPPPDVPTT